MFIQHVENLKTKKEDANMVYGIMISLKGLSLYNVPKIPLMAPSLYPITSVAFKRSARDAWV